MTSIAVSVYEPDGSTFIAHVPRRRAPQFLDELNGDGFGSFEFHLDDQVLLDHPTLLAGGNIVKMRPTSAASDVFGWQIEEVVPARTPEGEQPDRYVKVSGHGLRTLLASCSLYPEYGLAADSADDRGFSFASATASWPGYVSGDWVAPLGVAQNADPTARHGYPTDWPDGTAEWIWPTDPTVPSAAGRVWFRTTFTVASAGPVGIWATADNSFILSVNGDEFLSTDDPADLFSWKQMYSKARVLQPGTYTLAVQADNAVFTGSNPAGFLCFVATLDSMGIPVTVLRRTDTTNWLTHTYAPPEPGWHAASILKQAILESQARSEEQALYLTLGYSDTLDTSGASWTDIQSERFPINSDLLTMLGRLIELGMDVDVTPSLVVNAWKRKGTDLSATVRLLPGVNVLASIPTLRYGQLRNSAIVRHGSGWVLVEDSASITAHGKFATGLTLGATDSDTQASQQAQAFFDENAHPHITLPVRVSSAVGPQPYVDFVKGDTVTTQGHDGLLCAARVMSIVATEGDGSVTYDLALYPDVA